jgi:glycosyltransferase involved in cell wall biosynthesis
MIENISLSVILPIKSSKAKDFDTFFDKAINSLLNQEVKFNELIIVHTKEDSLVEFLDKFDFKDLNVVKLPWGELPNYSAQINYGVENSKSEWVTFFEFDDEYSKIWFKNFDKYAKIYPEVSGFLPVVVDVDNKEVFAGFTNEATFAANFTQEMGYLTNEILHDYQNFQTSGIILKKEVFINTGGFKPSFKLTFSYEFLLRLTYNGATIMTIPRLGYKHTNLREGSIFWNYKFGDNKITDDEVRFWLDTAKKEYFFTTDRNIKYESQ